MSICHYVNRFREEPCLAGRGCEQLAVLASAAWVYKVLWGKVTEAKVNAIWPELQEDSRMINDRGSNLPQNKPRR